MKIIYENTVTNIGNSADEFGNEMIIFFGDNAPEELRDYCYSLEIKDTDGDIKAGDHIDIDGVQSKILAVGDEAQVNLESLAHLTVNLSGNIDDLLPGAIVTEKVDIPDLKIGTEFRILED
ncbi:PTS system glucitol/sorbitol-specific transporter subunit IIA [Anaerococcus octavius]|uniref:PTS system glucitol/sorbitol-specific transporter subunit IIA n=1 Tax=Anaerococcus octavius TaxID=54007 RepID=A0A380WWC1_9FIRM|nr:PTS glucitol/sorbitol transporter subunit IIA [Anaerococcus octavius]SUU93099.1 PTS system glucitol/sorbitol-specific transporter subunit IIA [Anaerococcus octavius]